MHEKEDPLDLASFANKAARSVKIYLCPQCGFSLVPNEASKRDNPYLGSPFWCNSCDKVWDAATIKLKTSHRPVQSSVSKERPIIEFVQTNPDILSKPKGRTYDDVNPEPFEDANFKAQGMEIVSSTVELTDSHGNHQTFSREPDKKPDKSFRPITQLD